MAILIPRRHRSLICKLLVLIPVAWLTIAFLLYSDHHGEVPDGGGGIPVGGGGSASGSGSGEARPLQQQQQPPSSDRHKSKVILEANRDPEHRDLGVMPPPRDPNAPGELGKAVKIDNPEPDVKKQIDDGWQNNAFNQYVSDLISVHRSLPDPRDEW